MRRIELTRDPRRLRAAAVLVGLGIALTILVLPRLAGDIANATGDPVIAAAGDIACDPLNSNYNGGNGRNGSCEELAVSDLLVNSGYAAVLPLGDNQYYCGSYSAFTASYGPSWGRVLSVTHPAVGNHEYLTNGDSGGSTGCDSSNAGAAGYFRYFGAAAGTKGQGYYSYDVGAWHLIALNSNCGQVSCKAGSAQETWLANDLATHPNTCTLAYFHHPLFSAGPTTKTTVLPFWNDLYASHADVVLNGHKHNYERLTKLNPSGAPATNGIREIVAGTGGENHSITSTLYPGTEASDGSHFGILELTLHPAGYDWQFVSDTGSVIDSGSDACVT